MYLPRIRPTFYEMQQRTVLHHLLQRHSQLVNSLAHAFPTLQLASLASADSGLPYDPIDTLAFHGIPEIDIFAGFGPRFTATYNAAEDDNARLKLLGTTQQLNYSDSARGTEVPLLIRVLKSFDKFDKLETTGGAILLQDSAGIQCTFEYTFSSNPEDIVFKAQGFSTAEQDWIPLNRYIDRAALLEAMDMAIARTNEIFHLSIPSVAKLLACNEILKAVYQRCDAYRSSMIDDVSAMVNSDATFKVSMETVPLSEPCALPPYSICALGKDIRLSGRPGHMEDLASAFDQDFESVGRVLDGALLWLNEFRDCAGVGIPTDVQTMLRLPASNEGITK